MRPVTGSALALSQLGLLGSGFLISGHFGHFVSGHALTRRSAGWLRRRLSRKREARMIEAAMIWNEPNNKSHWDPEIDPDWSRFAEMCNLAARAIASENPRLPRV